MLVNLVFVDFTVDGFVGGTVWRTKKNKTTRIATTNSACFLVCRHSILCIFTSQKTLKKNE
jgi:hypothetical protein